MTSCLRGEEPIFGLFVPRGTFSGVTCRGGSRTAPTTVDPRLGRSGLGRAVVLPHSVLSRAWLRTQHQLTILAYLVAFVKRQKVRLRPPGIARAPAGPMPAGSGSADPAFAGFTLCWCKGPRPAFQGLRLFLYSPHVAPTSPVSLRPGGCVEIVASRPAQSMLG
jgi:hypothetical protein